MQHNDIPEITLSRRLKQKLFCRKTENKFTAPAFHAIQTGPDEAAFGDAAGAELL
jgi:hypothetical protein